MVQSEVIDANELARLQRQRENTIAPELHSSVIAGMVSAAARFIPLPFVDDLVRSKCRKYVVKSTLDSVGRGELLVEFNSLYNEPGGMFSGAAAMAAKVPLKILLFPIRKVVAVMTSVRGVPLEVIRCILIGRTVRRMADRADRPSKEALRKAFDSAFARMDFRVVRAVISDALEGIDRWSDAAIRLAKKVAANESVQSIESSERKPLDDGAERIEKSLNQPRITQLFSEFDSKLDGILNK
ncbi:hypothetical protein [Roseiconus lacunae]|uniref:hypothetical protein n=1 Tax=Roseiconus lacunae TaxID=2605694 RepID=UPI0011F1AE74|nr:hypothetical protein [Roseiconus lacunae]